jgi:hypothetical protein
LFRISQVSIKAGIENKVRVSIEKELKTSEGETIKLCSFLLYLKST